MSDHDMRTLLHDLADRPEPASAIDIAAARRAGKRRLWVQRGTISAAVAATLALAVVVPQTLFSATGSPTSAHATIAPASATAGPKTAPGKFNPLVPYAAFGYIPHGYEFQPSGGLPGGFTSTPYELMLSVKQVSGHGSIDLDVISKGACGYSIYLDEIPGYQAAHPHDGTLCNGARFTEVGAVLKPAIKAPDVNGRPAYWLQAQVHEAILAWQYAPDAWAILQAYPIDVSSATVAAQQAVLSRMAPAVKFGQAKPILFPFKLTSAIRPNWQTADVIYTVTSGGQYLATSLTGDEPVGIGGGVMGTVDPGPVTIATGRTCPTPAAVLSSATGPVNTVRENGISWRVENARSGEGPSGSTAEIACTVGLVNGLHTSVALAQFGNIKPIINSILAKIVLSPTHQPWG
jgi:hypothetical protein